MTASGLDMVYVTCPNNHRIGTRKESGQMLRCQRCFQELDQSVTVMVPPRPAEPPKRLIVSWGNEECRTCGDTAPRPGEKLLPPGWMTVMIGLDPAADKYGRPRWFVGPFCSACCAIAGLQAGRTAIRPPSGPGR